uniref:Enoyl CoA hydratase 1, peroxisomal n=2 Tax=Cyprinus carpio TaxID=7962 RepID=A0A9R1SPH7_CYPCA
NVFFFLSAIDSVFNERMSSTGGPTPPFTTLSVTREMVDCFSQIAEDSECHVMVFSGIDLMSMASDILQQEGDDTARSAWNLRRIISQYQETFSVIEKCQKPVILATHGLDTCYHSFVSSFTGVDLITACDIRLCTITVQEVDIGLAADVGTLQCLPSVSFRLVNELAFTARKMYADEAKSCGLVINMINLIYSRDHSVPEALNYINTWNMSMIQSQDLMKSAQAAMEKKNL